VSYHRTLPDLLRDNLSDFTDKDLTFRISLPLESLEKKAFIGLFPPAGAFTKGAVEGIQAKADCGESGRITTNMLGLFREFF
jgi:hypothetical protein